MDVITTIGFTIVSTFVISGMMYISILAKNCSRHRKKNAKYKFSF